MTIIEKMAAYAVSINKDTISADTLNKVNEIIRDCIGCILAGSTDISIKMIKGFAGEYGGAKVSSVIGDKHFKTDILNASMINAMEAHVRDFDDICAAMEGHPTIAVLPVALTLGEYMESSGTEMLEAYTAGVEIAGLLGSALFSSGYSMGWDTTLSQGVFGTTVAASKLLGLTEREMAYALGIAATEAGGLRASYGTMTKDLTAGRSAQKGVWCALAAKAGFNSSLKAFEDKSGLLAVATNGIDEKLFDEIIEKRKSTFLEPGMIMKLYPSCRGTHNAIDAAIEIACGNDIRIEDIDGVICYAQKAAMENDRYPQPKTPMEGKFSIPYCVALSLKNKHVGLADFDGDVIQDEKLMALCRKIEAVEDNSRFTDDAVSGCEVVVTMKDGRQLSKKVEIAKGDPKNQINPAELRSKFLECAKSVMNEKNAESLYDLAEDMTQIPNVKTFIKNINELLF